MNTFQEATLVSISAIQPISGWEEFLADGKKYMKTARTAHAARKSIFTPAILYNIIAMAIEKFVMAALMRHGTMPYNHTMADFVEAMEQNFPDAMKGGMSDDLLTLDSYQDICDPYEFTIIEPRLEEIPAMLELGGRLLTLVENAIAEQ